MSDVLKVRRGTNIKLKGEAEKILTDAPRSETYAIKPPDFEGIKPKVTVKEGVAEFVRWYREFYNK